MKTRNLVKVFAFALVLAAAASPALLAQDGTAPPEKSFSFQDLVGSWQGSNDIGVDFLLTFNRGRTYTVTFSIPEAGAAYGHGAWRRTGLDSFESTDVAFVFDSQDGSISLLQKTRARFVIAPSGDQVEIDLMVEITLPDGTPVETLTSSASAERIEVIPFP